MAARDGKAASKHMIPIIDKMMDVLAQMERHANGLTIRELTDTLSMPRTTIYRILNTLQHHEIVRRSDDGIYHLGRRLLSLAARTSTRFGEANLASTSQPFLDRLAAELGEGIKLSVLDRDEALVLAAAQGRREYALTVAAGQRMPLHSGAAGKMLLANLPQETIDYWLDNPLPAYTTKTITDPQKLRTELSRIRRNGWSEDRGEAGASIEAFAAPVKLHDGTVAAALSVPYLAGASADRMEDIRLAVVRSADLISAALKE
jgi:DNA-binding IclR family transcriptional regulator